MRIALLRAGDVAEFEVSRQGGVLTVRAALAEEIGPRVRNDVDRCQSRPPPARAPGSPGARSGAHPGRLPA
jgi:hypothetical protein